MRRAVGAKKNRILNDSGHLLALFCHFRFAMFMPKMTTAPTSGAAPSSIADSRMPDTRENYLDAATWLGVGFMARPAVHSARRRRVLSAIRLRIARRPSPIVAHTAEHPASRN